ncbi:MAG: hypothetical protein DRP87_18290, partial [Spirochaetes bacterium]
QSLRLCRWLFTNIILKSLEGRPFFNGKGKTSQGIKGGVQVCLLLPAIVKKLHTREDVIIRLINDVQRFIRIPCLNFCIVCF